MSSNRRHSSILYRSTIRPSSRQIRIRIRDAPNVDLDDTMVGSVIAQIKFTWVHRVLRYDLYVLSWSVAIGLKYSFLLEFCNCA